jgi:hypothetical protein
MFCSTSRMVTPLAFSSRRRSIMLLMIAGARPLLGSSIISSARLDDRARNRQHLLLPARQLAGRVVPELLHRGEQREDPVQPLRVDLRGVRARARPAACSPSPSGRQRCPCSRARRRCRGRRSAAWRLRDVLAVEVMRPCEARHRPMMVRSVVVLPAPLRPSSMVSCPRGTARSTPCRMWYAPMCVCTPCSVSRLSLMHGLLPPPWPR